MRKSIRYVFSVFFYATYLHAQDPHFSQFNEQASLVNPALTGVDYGMKATASYKNQWKSVSAPYKTYGMSFESRLKPGGWEQVDKHRSMTFKERGTGRLAAGLSVFKDRSGDGALDMTQANLSLATFVPTGKKSFMSFAMQGSFTQRKINSLIFVFPNQYNGNGYDQSMSSHENFESLTVSYGEIAAGLAWSYKNKLPLASHEKTKATIGFSVYHINKPEQKFLVEGKDRLYSKYVAYGDFMVTTPNPRIAVAPKFLIQKQGSSFEALAGVMIKHFSIGSGSKYTGIGKSSIIAYGIYYRNKDAVVLNSMFEWKEQFAVGLSYDINISSLASTSYGRGGVEIMLRFTPPGAFLYQMKKKPESDTVDPL